ncbi:hypothetical protein OH76DRAFT_801606 [Lentinus brumalis]|uniref:C3H1-type domain-containing protein n=1 Tax=Lentinus brumalis TaxID=2498619 RepID=A0A371D384_9APHY|nr:hypothetical protein OH76DRAFT_801606 [Polyporus brumalis]
MTIEDPPWKKRTRPCPFYSQGRCLFADGCNFMHSVKIRRPDSMVGSEDSDQPDFRLVVDSPSRPKSVRFRSPTRSPRTSSLLLALGNIIQQEEEEVEWDEEESGEQESSSGEGSSEDHGSGDYEPAATSRSLVDGQVEHPNAAPDPVPESSARPTPIVGLSEDARRLLHHISSPHRDESPILPESSLGDGSVTLVDGNSTRPGSPTGENTTMYEQEDEDEDQGEDEDEDFTVTRRPSTPDRAPSSRRTSHNSQSQESPTQSIIVSEFTTSTRASIVLDAAPPSRRPPTILDTNVSSVPDSQPLSRRTSLASDVYPPPRRASIHSSRHDSMSSGLLSPIEISSAPISFPRYGSFMAREDSVDSGYAEGPEPLRASPPRSPRRISTLSILSSPFGSPSARGLFGSGFDQAAPTASALFTPRFGSFPASFSDDARHSRDGSVDSLQFTSEEPSVSGSQFADADSSAEYDIQVEEPSSIVHRQSSSISEAPEDSSLFQLGSSSDYLAVGDDTLRVSEASFGSDDSMASLYDQYYTPTVHSTKLENGSQEQAAESPLDLSYLQDISPLTVVGAQMALPEQPAEPEASLSYLASSDSQDDTTLVQSSSSDFTGEHGVSAPDSAEDLDNTDADLVAARPQSVASSSARYAPVFSPPHAYPASVASSGQIRNFSLPSSARSAHNSLVFAADSRSASPAASAQDDNFAEGSTRSASSLSSHGPERSAQRQSSQSSSSSQSGSRKVPFGFRNSVSDRSQVVARRPESVNSERPRPPPSVAIDTTDDDLPSSRAATPLSPVEETPLTASSTTSNPRRLKPLRLSMILNSASSPLGSSVPPSSIPSLTTATTAASALTPSSPTVSSEYSISNNRLVCSSIYCWSQADPPRCASIAIVSALGHYTFALSPYLWIFTAQLSFA